MYNKGTEINASKGQRYQLRILREKNSPPSCKKSMVETT